MRKIIINSRHNRMIVLVFTLVFIINLFSLFSVNSEISKITYNLLSFLGIPVTLILTFLPKFKNDINQVNKEEKSKHFVGLLDNEDKNYDKLSEDPRVLKREDHRKRIVEKINKIFELDCDTKGLVITGESGAGKSVLLSFLIKDFRDAGYLVYLNNEYKFTEEINDEGYGIPANIKKDKKYILIFDQFEEYIRVCSH